MKYQFYLGVLFLIVAVVAFRWESPSATEETRMSPMSSLQSPPLPQAQAVTLPPVNPAAPVNAEKISHQEFKNLLQKTFSALPTIAIVRERPNDDFHHTPPELIQSSQWLGKVADAIQTNPDLIDDGLRFYDECARNSEFFTATRAVCLSNLKDLANRSAGKFPYNSNDYPEEVVRVANKLPPIF